MQAVVEQFQPLGARIGWGILAAVTAVDALLLQLAHQHIGWRQHSWLSCDLRRPHAAERQLLQHALNRYTTLATCCAHVLLISLVDALVLVLSAHPAPDSTQPDSGSASEAAEAATSALQTAQTGVLVSVGLTLLPLLWLALTRWALRRCGRRPCSHAGQAALVASTTFALAELLPVRVPCPGAVLTQLVAATSYSVCGLSPVNRGCVGHTHRMLAECRRLPVTPSAAMCACQPPATTLGHLV